MKSITSAALLLLAFALSSPAFAGGGLLQTLPKDGAWVKFTMNMKSNGPVKRDVSGELTLCSVGTETVNGEKCRWIEMQFVGGPVPKDGKAVTKFLIREKDFGPKAKQGLRIIRGWKNNPNGIVTELQDKDKSPSGEMMLFFGSMKKPKIRKAEKVVDYQKGQLKLTKAITGGLAFQPPGQTPPGYKYVPTQTVWKHKSIPFGTAIVEVKLIFEKNGKAETIAEFSFTVQDFGTGAKSALPEKK